MNSETHHTTATHPLKSNLALDSLKRVTTIRNESILLPEPRQTGAVAVEELLSRVRRAEVRIAEDTVVVIEPGDGLPEEVALLIVGAEGLEL